METHEVLVRARNLIAERGWWDGGDEVRGSVCAVLALGDAGADIFTDTRPAECALAAAAGIDYGSVSDLYRWNDSHSSADPVLAAFDKAIAETAPLPADPFPLTGVPSFAWAI